MSDILIGPGTGCLECNEVYGQHLAGCSAGKRQQSERRLEEKEERITKRELLKRIEALEKAMKAKP